jgi:transposase
MRRMRRRIPDVRQALQGRVSPQQRFRVRQIRTHLDGVARAVQEGEQQLAA